MAHEARCVIGHVKDVVGLDVDDIDQGDAVKTHIGESIVREAVEFGEGQGGGVDDNEEESPDGFEEFGQRLGFNVLAGED